MKKPRSLSTRIFAAIVMQLCVSLSLIGQDTRSSTTSTLDDLQVPAPALAGNLLGDPTRQHVFVYLPPSYKKEAAKRYPTLYLLHGYTGRPEDWIKDAYQGMSLQSEMDSLIAKGISAEMIVVVPNGRNAYLGSFYMNSEVTGNWEDYIVRDVVKYVDGRYRTLARSTSRGIAGHSMGGYGAFMIAMKHPDIFGATYALSPCCLGLDGDLSGDNRAWLQAGKVSTRDVFSRQPPTFDDFFVNAMIALSAALSPNRNRGPLNVDFPFIEKDGFRAANEAAYGAYRAKMPLYLVEQHRTNLMKLRGIFFDVGDLEEFSHIKLTTAKLSWELSQRQIAHTFEIYKGGSHGNKIRERFHAKLVPFFSSVLEKEVLLDPLWVYLL
jgi:S-formylglutathione hydrolase